MSAKATKLTTTEAFKKFDLKRRGCKFTWDNHHDSLFNVRALI